MLGWVSKSNGIMTGVIIMIVTLLGVVLSVIIPSVVAAQNPREGQTFSLFAGASMTK
jgi:uncharacterized membrane protein YadS